MNAPTISAQQLAALADGRLSPSDRAALLAQLRDSPDDVELLADALYAIREVPSHTTSDIQRLNYRSRTVWYRRTPAIMAVAATALLCVGIPYWRSGRVPQGPETPAQVLASLGDLQSARFVGWQSDPFTATRGASSVAPSTSARDIRLGALLVNLELAYRRQPSEVRTAAARIAAVLDEMPAADPVTKQFQAIMDRASEPNAELRSQIEQAQRDLIELAGTSDLTLGIWLQRARVAAMDQSQPFFATKSASAMLQRLTDKTAGLNAARQHLLVVQQALKATAPDWTAIEQALTGLLTALGGG